MRVVVLLSSGRHPVSGRPAPVEVELQAIRLARRIAMHVIGVHAGPETDLLREHGGYGIDFIHRLDGPAETATLLPTVRALEPDILLAGRRGMGGTDSGMLPYRLAHALGWPIVADATSLDVTEAGFEIAQFRMRGARRIVTLRGPIVASVHHAAPPPPPFTFAHSRMVSINTVPQTRELPPSPVMNIEEQPYRKRPRVIPQNAAPRTRTLLRDVTPQAAAEAILDHLARLGFIPPAASS
jgi:electron transfer flavoprotein beta subunit